MGQTDRLVKLRALLEGRRSLPRDVALRQLEVSRATLTRDIAFLRDRLNTPIVWDRATQAWQLDRGANAVGTQIELPGMWLSADECHALLTMQHLLSNLDAGGLLGAHIEPLRKKLTQMLGTGSPKADDIRRRIKVLTVGARKLHLPHFQAVAGALLRRQRLVIDYRNHRRMDVTEREVSPQRLVHYRDNWYLDAWCHLRTALRSFSVDAIERVQVIDRRAEDIADTDLDDALGSGYGIFAGRPVKRAKLRFSPERSRWVSAERWHPHQRGRFDRDGC